MKLVDVHCHLESGEFTGILDRIIREARDAGIVRLITCSITPSQWDYSRELSGLYDEVDFAIGVHPWYAVKSDRDKIELLANAVELGAVAIGEIGLDKKIQNSDYELQSALFQRQLEIAKDINLPVIIHCRGAFGELAAIIKKTGLPARGGIIHAFSGSAETAEELMKLGLSFSLGGSMTYRLSNKRLKMIEKIYPEHFMLESDSPDIPPVSVKEGPNLPSYIIHSLRAAAQILNVSEEEIAEHTTANAARIFNLRIE